MLHFLRNPELKRMAIVLGIITFVLSFSAFLIHPYAGWAALAASLFFSLAFYLFQGWKYRQLAELSSYLRRIVAGEYDLDVRSNEEGELSILKSEIYKVTVMLSEYNTQLRKDKVKLSDAMSDISHQLKTPLTSMMMMADLLSEDDLPPDKRKVFTEQLRSQLERIQWLTSSLLKLSRLDVGTAAMKHEPVNIRKLAEKAIEPLLIPMELKEQTLTLNGSDSASFTGDFSWSAEALLNILKNCVEHTPAGGALCIEWKDNPITAEITVSDNGEGISKEDLPHVFTRFYRGKNAESDSVGIGLAMAQSIFRGQGGDVTVRSERSKGTAFTIHIYKTIV